METDATFKYSAPSDPAVILLFASPLIRLTDSVPPPSVISRLPPVIPLPVLYSLPMLVSASAAIWFAMSVALAEMLVTLVAISDVFVAMSEAFVVMSAVFDAILVAFVEMLHAFVVISEAYVPMSVVFVAMFVALVEILPELLVMSAVLSAMSEALAATPALSSRSLRSTVTSVVPSLMVKTLLGASREAPVMSSSETLST